MGRGSESGHVAALLTAARAGRGGALVVTGEPGSGKTRLAAEALASAATAGMVTARGRAATVTASGLPYRPLTEALLTLGRDEEDPDPAELGRYGPVLARLMDGTAGTGAAAVSPLVAAEAVLRLLAVAGRGRGSLLVLHDLDAADTGTLAVVEYLLDHLGPLPVALLLTTGKRAGPAAALVTRARRNGTAVTIEPTPLALDDVRHLMPGDDPAAARRVLHDSAGIPFFARELARAPKGALPAAVAECVRGRAARLGALGGEVLGLAALFGERFPVTVLAHATGRADGEIAAVLGAAVDASLLVPDPAEPEWYAFHPPLAARAVREGLAPGERTGLARRAARALAELRPGLPGAWCVHAAELHERAGEPERAADHYAEAADRATAENRPGRALELLRRAHDLLDPVTAPGPHALVLGRLLDTALQTGRLDVLPACVADRLAVEQAGPGGASPASVPETRPTGPAAPPPAPLPLPEPLRATLHARLAELHALAGRPSQAVRELDVARWLLGDGAADDRTAVVELAAAHVEPGRVAPERLRTAAGSARRAAEAALGAGLPEAAGRALLALGRLTVDRDGQAAADAFVRARDLAVAHGLGPLRIAADACLARLALRSDGLTAAVEQARREAAGAGLLPVVHETGHVLALDRIRRGDFTAAGELIRDGVAEASRHGLGRAEALWRLTEAVRWAHQGRRPELGEALTRLAPLVDAAPGVRAREYGLARAFCSLLEEDHEAAEREFAQAVAYDTENPTTGDHGRFGPALLLGVLAGRMGRPHLGPVFWTGPDQGGTSRARRATEEGAPGAASPAGSEGRALHGAVAAGAARAHWNRTFTGLAHAVLLGREGRPDEATGAARAALDAAEPYPVARHLGLRLVARAAYEDGWGAPVDWLREAEEHFHGAGLAAVAGACRALLRGMGASVRQRRSGTERVPAVLRRHGITVREFEVARLLAERFGNQDIAGRLHISPRTVEKHVASLLQKTGHPNRQAFASAARELVADSAP
ncbi:AAA family ATPase [Streptomyces sp. NPDC101160]|uniref:helix-turn-helix transcriptional regulator n=1 Tax=Streptomyces sp. NPDC101160 TaxID=3366118 RepID=UPI003812D6E1